MSKIAWVFPGQGSQKLGMGGDLIDLPLAQNRFKQAQDVLGWDVREICLTRELELSQTLYTQPCLYVISTVLADLMKDAGFNPSIVAGHSLGEYAALYTAEVISFKVGLNLVKRRAELMTSAPQGMMVALIGFNRDRLEQTISQTPDVVIANDNHHSQIVISGTSAGVNKVLNSVKVRRSIPLKVSGAFHSPLMAEVSSEFEQILQAVTFKTARVPVMSNVEPFPATKASILKNRLIRQMTGGVRWREIVEQLSIEDVKKVIEIGPGQVLSNLIQRIYPDLELSNVSNNMTIKELGKVHCVSK